MPKTRRTTRPPRRPREKRWPAELPVRKLLTMFAAYNPREIDPFDYEQLRYSIAEYGYVQQVVVNKRTKAHGWPARSRSTIVGGHQGVRASKDEGLELLPVKWVDLPSDDEKKLNLLLNRTSGRFVPGLVDKILRELKAGGDSLERIGFSTSEIEGFIAGEDTQRGIDTAAARKTLRERFVVPPFSVLDARQGYWRRRKEAWLSLGINSDRQRNLLITSDSGRDPAYYEQKREVEKRLGRKLTTAEYQADHYKANEDAAPGLSSSGTSGFDPVLCELVYRWFCPPGGRVFDPFAGGSVGGIVAGFLGREYLGLELSGAQVKANQKQSSTALRGNADGPTREELAIEGKVSKPKWLQGDAQQLASLVPGEFDFVFSSPPFYNLEKYSEDESDLSAADSYGAFLDALSKVMAGVVEKLRPDRFLAFVLGETRERSREGFYLGLVPDTIAAVEEAGARFYNEAVLVTALGSVPVRAGRQFDRMRKLGKTHQNVLVFVKGDPAKATEAIGLVQHGSVEPAVGAELETS